MTSPTTGTDGAADLNLAGQIRNLVANDALIVHPSPPRSATSGKPRPIAVSAGPSPGVISVPTNRVGPSPEATSTTANKAITVTSLFPVATNQAGPSHETIAGTFKPTTVPINQAGPSYLSPSDLRSLETNVTEIKKKLQDMQRKCNEDYTNSEGMRRPKAFKTKMQQHQMVALRWLVGREKAEPACGIFADDMGLGKTATIIALILKSTMEVVNQNQGDSDVSEDESSEPTSTSQESSEPAHASTAIPDPHGGEAGATQNPKGGTLIVCPLSLIGHWENEIMKHVTEPHGQHLSVRTHRGREKTDNPRRLAEQTTVVITTYDMVRREANKGPLFKVSWDRLILDEAHEIRNPDTKGCNAVTSLEAKRRWCITGTPLHNSLTDLYALYKVLKWEPFNNKDVWETLFGVFDMERPDLWTALKEASMLRRLKSELKYSKLNRLPEKNLEYIFIDLDLNESEAYDAVANFSSSLIDSARPYQNIEKRRNMLMYCILLMRQITNHPSLLKVLETPDSELDLDEPVVIYDSNDDLDAEQRQMPLEIPDEWLGTKRDLQQYLNLNDPVYDATRLNTKVEKLMEKLAEVIKKGDKAVVVSQWTRMLDIIGYFLPKKKIPHKTLKGGMSINDRDAVVDSFNKSSSGPKVLLLSLKAGGVGLNLVGANHLFLCDVHWNPQLEAQACDRIHRLGQKKTVFIYKLVARGTIEEVIAVRQQEKLNLAERVLDNPTAREIRKLKSLAENDEEIVKIIKKASGNRKRKATTDLIGIENFKRV